MSEEELKKQYRLFGGLWHLYKAHLEHKNWTETITEAEKLIENHAGSEFAKNMCELVLLELEHMDNRKL